MQHSRSLKNEDDRDYRRKHVRVKQRVKQMRGRGVRRGRLRSASGYSTEGSTPMPELAPVSKLVSAPHGLLLGVESVARPW